MNEIYGHFQFSYCSAQSILLHLRRHKRTGGTITVACSWLLLNIVIRFNEIAWVVILMPEKVEFRPPKHCMSQEYLIVLKPQFTRRCNIQ